MTILTSPRIKNQIEGKREINNGFVFSLWDTDLIVLVTRFQLSKRSN